MNPPDEHFGPVPHEGAPRVAETGDQVQRLLSMLKDIAGQAEAVVARGQAAYLEDSAEGVVRRLAGTAVVIRVATVVERLPDSYKAARSEVPWRDITAMRNLAAHRYERLDDVVVWRTLVADLPDLVRSLGL